jgi:dipeptidyl-peptidase-4
VTQGIAEFVAQEEMHRLSGYCWSPDSQSIAFQQADHRGVEVWQISDPLHPETPPQVQYYPRPRQKNVRSRLGIAALKGGPVRWLPIPDEYLASLRWSAQGLTVQVQDRRQQRLRLLLDTPKGWKTLVEERHPAWVPLSQEVPLWLDKEHFLYLRLQQDHMALAECSLDGQTRFLDPQPNYDILEIVGLNANKSAVLCRIDQQPGNPRLHWLPIRGQAPADPSAEGVTEAFLGKKGLLIGQQSMDQLPRWLLDGQELSGLGETPARLPEVTFETVQAQGLEFRTAMLRPRDFDPNQRYPVILDAYGGPTKVQVAHNLRAWLMDQWLADQGFIVVSVDNRGTPGRGRAWEAAVYGKFDSVPIGDQEAALRALCARHPFLDAERIGVWGWSFGGFLAAQSVLQRPEFFKAAVAGAPVTDWDDYDTHYTERYLGIDPAPYRASDLTRRAQSLTRPLLLVHGSADDNVYYRHSLRLSEALLRHGQAHQLLTLPGITHSFRADVQITKELWRRSVEFFQEHLGKPR